MANENATGPFLGEPLEVEQGLPPANAVPRRADGIAPDARVDVVGDAVRAHASARPRAGRSVKPFTLTNGATALVREVSGRDLLKGAEMALALNSASQLAGYVGILAAVTTVAGEPVPVEDFLEWPGEDLSMLIDHLMGGNAPPPALGT